MSLLTSYLAVTSVSTFPVSLQASIRELFKDRKVSGQWAGCSSKVFKVCNTGEVEHCKNSIKLVREHSGMDMAN